MVLKDIPPAARPREKLLAFGPGVLADAELIALLLRTGLPGVSVLQLAQQLLDAFGGVAGLLQTSTADLKRIKGLGPAKRAEISAVLELARRSLSAQLSVRTVLASPEQVRDFARLTLARRTVEVFAVMFLDSQNRLICFEDLFEGSLSQTSVYPREVVKRAIALNASAVILAHNHPSGLAEPSRADEFMTQQLKHALGFVDVKVFDHLVIGGNEVISFAERGLL